MTNIIPTISAAGLGAYTFQPLPDVTPFSIRVGASYEDILSTIRTWLRDELVPYLNDNSAEAIFQSNADTLVDRVNTALTDQAGIVTAALNAAVQEVVTADIPIADAVIAAVLGTVSSATRLWADTHYAAGVTAPAPSGGDDTAMLNALLATFGTVRLQAGTYRCNLSTPSAFTQPLLIGMGRRFTILKAFDTTKPVLQFNGGSGAMAGGGARALFVDGTDRHITTTVGIVFAGCGGVAVSDVEIENCAVGVQWWNNTGSNFTEFDTFEGSIYNTLNPFVYRDDNGVESFHGSGPVGNTVVGLPTDSTAAVISTIGNALPYNAPCSMAVFFTATTQTLFNYVNTTAGRHASFYGRITAEGVGASQLGNGTQRVLFAGEIIHLGSGNSVLGNIYLCSKINYDGSAVIGELRPITERYTLANTPTQRFAGVLTGGETAQVVVHITHANYDVSMVLLCYQSMYDASGVVHIQDTLVNIDSSNVGLPTFSWNNGLYISNANYNNTFFAFTRMTILGGVPRSNDLAQLA